MRRRVSNLIKVHNGTSSAANNEGSFIQSNSTNSNNQVQQDDVERASRSSNSRNNPNHPQYRLEATTNVTRNQQGWWNRIVLYVLPRRYTTSSLEIGVNPNQKLAQYLHWMFRVNFFFLFVVMCVTFFALVILFSGFITLAGRIDSECVRVGGQVFGAAGTPFADAFALSWTTFATVGYVSSQIDS
jgi:hypothetical protein